MSDAKPQDVVYGIIKNSKIMGLGYIATAQIKIEAKDTSLAKYANEYFENDKLTKLERQVTQAIRELHKKGLIKRKGYGKWTIVGGKKITQIVCKHIEKRDNDMWWCPIKNIFIGDPKKQCNVLFESDVHSRPIEKYGDGIKQFPRCVGFTDRKSNAVRIEMSKKAVAVQEEREERDRRRNSHDIHDPESKKYMPKLHEQKVK